MKQMKMVSFNNKKKVLDIIYSSGKHIVSHYSIYKIKKNIVKAWIDKETRGMSIGLEFEDGKKDFIPYDQPLYFAKDAEYLLQLNMEKVIACIKDTLKEMNISKRFLASQLNTSDNQIHRLLNPDILNKNIGQLYKIAALLGLDIELNIKKAA
jgi:hypothetical protein